MPASEHRIVVYRPPLPPALSDELVAFWQDIFQTDYQPFRGVLNGEESEYNQDAFYLVQESGRTVGSAHLTLAGSNPELGGLGEVATTSEFRGRGLATALCTRARDDFRQAGGQALFLGTVNPDAARLYHRLGWRKMAGANAMAFISDRRSPEAFLVDYFRDGSNSTVATGSMAARVPMIPLIFVPHDWQLMDANIGLISTRYADQNSCMMLYPRYAALAKDGFGTWFCARSSHGRTVGLASARLDGAGGCQMDGFAHHCYQDTWETLIAAASDWAIARGANSCWIRVSREDEQKIGLCGALGFRPVGDAEPCALGTRQVPALRLEKTRST